MSKGRLGHHTPYVKLMEAAAKNGIYISNDIDQPGTSCIFYHNQKGKGVVRRVAHNEAGTTVQRILDMREGVLLLDKRGRAVDKTE